MEKIQTLIADLWDRANPKEPSALFLVYFLAFAFAVFGLGIYIGAA